MTEPMILPCLNCHHPTVNYYIRRRRPDLQPDTRARHGRQLCSTCYCRLRRTGDHIDYPRQTRSRAELAEEYAACAPGSTRAQFAERLGITRGVLDQAIRRARLAGDPILTQIPTGYRHRYSSDPDHGNTLICEPCSLDEGLRVTTDGGRLKPEPVADPDHWPAVTGIPS